MIEEVFNVYQWVDSFDKSTIVEEKVRENVTSSEAFEAFRHYTENVAAQMGLTSRVIITNSADLIVMEWVKDKGLVWPK